MTEKPLSNRKPDGTETESSRLIGLTAKAAAAATILCPLLAIAGSTAVMLLTGKKKNGKG